MSFATSPQPTRQSGGNWVRNLLLAGILAVLVALLVVVLFSRGPEGSRSPSAAGGDGRRESSTAVDKPGEVAKPAKPAEPPPVGNPRRLRDVLQPGKTYRVTSTMVLNAPVRDKEWGFERSVYLAYRVETVMNRFIEANDGHRVVERRTIEAAQLVKATSTVQIRFEYTAPGSLLIGGLDLLLTGGQILLAAPAVIEPLCAGAAAAMEAQLNEQNTKVRAMLDSLSGKTVRMVFEDGKGVTSLEPIDCSLTEEERDFLFASAVVLDAYLLPDVESKPGDSWQVPGEAFSDLMPPSWRGAPKGSVTVRREEDFQRGGKLYARLRCEGGRVWIDATDVSRARLAQLVPRGQVIYNITDGHVESAELRATASIEEASRDHLLFETRFETQPELQLTYACQIVGGSQ